MIVDIDEMHINIKNRVHNRSVDLIRPKKVKNKKILIDEKNFKNLVIYFTRYVKCELM